MDLQVILGSFGHWQGGLWLRSLKNSPVFAPQVLATNPTFHDHQGPNDDLRCTVHQSFDPLEAGEMDLQVILGSFGHWQGGLWLRSLKMKTHTRFCPKSWPQIQHSMMTRDQMTISGALFIIL
jgi:DNA-binding transcriptional LysR family regulator